jgi:hypothetical protein
MDWLLRQWNDIKGNVKYGILAALWWVIVEVGKHLLRYIPNMPTWAIWAILLGLSLLMFVWLMRSMKLPVPAPALALQLSQTTQPSGTVVPGIPSLSALLGQAPQITFDAKTFFAQAYYSPLTAEFETNIKIIARQYSPNDTESFYTRFLGVGAVAYQHDVTWFTIYKSQLLALAELNARGLIPLTEVKRHYDKAMAQYPRTYARYSFEQWMNYLQSRLLALKHSSNMVEITHGGRDFLKYVAHKGWDANTKAN